MMWGFETLDTDSEDDANSAGITFLRFSANCQKLVGRSVSYNRVSPTADSWCDRFNHAARFWNLTCYQI